MIWRLEQLPSAVACRPGLVTRVESGERITLSDKAVRELTLHEDIANDVLVNLRYQMSVANVVGASLLTNRNVDVDVLSYISNDKDIARRNAIAAKYLTSIVPFAGDVPIPKLLLLRKREEAAFLRFRSALDASLREVLAQRSKSTPQDARSIYVDLIAPELARLDQSVAAAKRDLIKVPLAAAAGTAAIIAFGIYSGMVPTELAKIAGALGLAKVVYDTATQVVNLSDVEKSVRPEKFYFPWKVKHAGDRVIRHHV
jgi:hypothetical protein